ncbi:MAG: TIGR02266 family protein [Deltaproteobacteria bacterium]|nr:TIGR02266 family protein [Deltaproteobacteria bacterium]
MSIEDSINTFGEKQVPIELKVEYKRVNTFLSDFCKNISRNYTFIKTKNPLPVGTLFLFRIVAPGIDEPLNIRGFVKKVVTVESATDGESAGMDIQFEYEEQAERESLMRRVHALIDESLGYRLGEKIRMYIEERNA